MKTSHIFFIFLAVLALSVGALYLVDRSDRINITEYIETRNERVIEIDRNMTTMGSPFYIAHKNNRIYRAVSDKHVYWFRKGNLFGDDVVIE